MQRFGACFVLVVVVVFSSGCVHPYERGMQALAHQDFEAAKSHAREGLDRDIASPQSNVLMAQALIGQEQYHDALPYADRAFKSGAINADAGRVLGKVYWELGRAIEAVDAWRVARAADPTSVSDTDYQRALEAALVLATSRQNFQTVLSIRTELGAIDRDHPEASDDHLRLSREQLAESLVQQGSLVEAVAINRALLEEYPERVNYAMELGVLLVRLDRADEAIAAWQNYIDTSEPSRRGQRLLEIAQRADQLGATGVSLHFYTQALEDMESGEVTFRRAQLRLHMAGLLMSTSNKAAARLHVAAYLEDMRKLRGLPLSPEVYVTAADTALNQQDSDLAFELLEEAMVESPASWRVAQTLAELYARRAKADDVERVLKLYVERADATVDAEINAARWAAGRRNFALARFFYERAVARDSSSKGDIWLELARIYAATNASDELKIALENFVKDRGENRQALLDVAAIFLGQRMFEDAERALKRALKQEPSSLSVVDRLAAVYVEWSKPRELHALFEQWIRVRGNRTADFQLVGERFTRRAQWDDALPYFMRAAREGHFESWLQVADIYRRQRRDSDMKGALDRYVAAAPNRNRALREVLTRYRSSTLQNEAVRILEELIRLEPREWSHYEQLTELYFEQRREREAFELVRRYIESAERRLDALETIARRFENRGYSRWLLVFYHQLLKGGESDPRIYRLMADAYLQAAQYNHRGDLPLPGAQREAEAYYSRYLDAADPSYTELRDFASNMRAKNMWAAAARAYDKLLSKGPPSGQMLLHYGNVLLNLGEAEKAEDVFQTHYEMRSKNLKDGRTIAQNLVQFHRYRAAEPYLLALFGSDNQEYIQAAFASLAEIYRNSDRSREVPALITKYLARSQNPARARQAVLTVLENAGMWSEAVDQITRMRGLQGDTMTYQLAVNLYRAGKPDRALESFEQFASQSSHGPDAWLAVARFYEGRGEVSQALEAYDQALALAADHGEGRLQRGRLRIRTGDIEGGTADIELAATAAEPTLRSSIWSALVESMSETGRFNEALEASRRALSTNPFERSLFMGHIAEDELTASDPARVEQAIARLRADGMELAQLISALERHGHVEQAVAVIENELVVGDQDMAAQVLLTHAGLFTRLGGIDRLLEAARPLLDPPRIPDLQFMGTLGEFLVREGELERGVLFLRHAIDLGHTPLIPLLAHSYMLMGDHAQALSWFQQHLSRPRTDAQGTPATAMDLRLLALRFEFLGEHERFIGLLRHLVTQERFASAAAPMLMHYTIDAHNDPEAAIALLREGPWMLADNAERSVIWFGDAHADSSVEVVQASLEAIAARGFVAEVEAFIADLPETVRTHDRLRDLSLRLSMLSSDPDADGQLRQALERAGGAQSGALERLNLARMLNIHGHYAHANEIARPLLVSADFAVSRNAIEVMLSNARASGQDERVDKLVESFVAQAADKQLARGIAADQLARLGYDQGAAALRDQSARAVPTETNILRALSAARNNGDQEAVARLSSMYWQVAEAPATTVEGMAALSRSHLEPELIEPLLMPVREGFGAMLEMRMNEVNLRFGTGDVEAGRALILELLQDTAFQPRTVEYVLDQLVLGRLYVEAARFLAPQIPVEKLTRHSHRHLGLANIKLGFDEDAATHFQQYIAMSSDPAIAAIDLGKLLIDGEHYGQALEFAQLAIDAHPQRPEPYLIRGISLLATGQVDAARADLDRVESQGLGRQFSYYRIARAAFSANEASLANEYLARLARTPVHDIHVTQPYRLTLATFIAPGRAAYGASFLEQHYPRLAAGLTGSIHSDVTMTLPTLFEHSGHPQQAYAVYESLIAQEQVRGPLDSAHATYLNNLAYVYSTTDHNIELGLDMVRRAIAGSRERSPSFIDTLGWLYYRQGNYVKAEAEVRRALRSSSGAPYELAELYSHLADLLELQGRHNEAIWLRIFMERVE